MNANITALWCCLLSTGLLACQSHTTAEVNDTGVGRDGARLDAAADISSDASRTTTDTSMHHVDADVVDAARSAEDGTVAQDGTVASNDGAGLDAQRDGSRTEAGADAPGRWRSTDQRFLPSRPYYNCISADGTAIGYTLDRGVFETRRYVDGRWQAPINYDPNPVLGNESTGFRHCAFSEDGNRLLITSDRIAVVAERSGATYATLASLTPLDATFSDMRALFARDGRRAVLGNLVFEDVRGGWQNWMRTILPDAGLAPRGPHAGVPAQYSGAGDLHHVLAVGRNATNTPRLRAVFYTMTGNQWSMRDVSSACRSTNCVLNDTGDTTFSCDVYGSTVVNNLVIEPTTLQCATRSLEGQTQRSIIQSANELAAGAISIDRAVELGWAGADPMLGVACYRNASTAGFGVYQWTQDRMLPFEVRGPAIWGWFSASRDGTRVLISNSGGFMAWVFDR